MSYNNAATMLLLGTLYWTHCISHSLSQDSHMLKHSSNGAILVTCCSYACGVIIKADSMHSVIQFSKIPTYEFFQPISTAVSSNATHAHAFH